MQQFVNVNVNVNNFNNFKRSFKSANVCEGECSLYL